MIEKTARARIEAYALLATIPQQFVTPKLHLDVIEALQRTADQSLNLEAARELIGAKLDELSLIPGVSAYTAENWKAGQRPQSDVPLCFEPGEAGDRALEALVAAMA